eukprot:CAMPEP_0172521040 /NCGR_PEP_ID=MMETSP1066-20121228/292349_1 /TAXON_ID=671091 /ORGANISM="Coscinodiscus wailesii, Strain CCMP2513" /LENGTH=247 /DNA_ID=CAMNT_0013303889 /DNA_START=658 /DNA_END=1401 /DNA_ORIENTATION=-
MEQVAVMQNIFCGRKISRTFDLKGSLRGRFARQYDNHDKDKSSSDNIDSSSDASHYTKQKLPRPSSSKSLPKQTSDGSFPDSEDGSTSEEDDDDNNNNNTSDDDDVLPSSEVKDKKRESKSESKSTTLLDGDFLEFTAGRPLPLNDRAKTVFHMSILNDTLFLSIINVLDYSILVGIDDEKKELVIGIIDFMRQYDILKQMERVGKSLPMVVGSEAPTIIQPPLYKARFTNAMERYFMTVPSKWTTI